MKQLEGLPIKMTREVDNDFNELKKYIKNYNIKNSVKNTEYAIALKSMHKKYIATIYWDAEMKHNKKDFSSLYVIKDENILWHINESVSDIGSSLFNWMNGNYKASRVMLRISIENFIRAISSIEKNSQLKEMSTYKLFEIAAATKIISNNSLIKKHYDKLHNDYKLLCKDIHTASKLNMSNITSLVDFPSFNKIKSNECKSIFIRVSENITILLCLLFNEFYHSMHHRNKENIINALPGTLKAAINNAEK